MVARSAKNLTNAKMRAATERRKGLNASIFEKKKGYGISVTRK